MRQNTYSISQNTTHRFHLGNHLNMSGETWVFSPYLANEASRQIQRLFAKFKQTTVRLCRKLRRIKQRRQLNTFVPRLQPVVVMGDVCKHLQTEIVSVGANGSRDLQFNPPAYTVNPRSFVIYLNQSPNLRLGKLTNMAAFNLNPLRPDLLNNTKNALARETNHEFLISDNWFHVKKDARWIGADKLKLHLASLHKQAYLICRLKSE